MQYEILDFSSHMPVRCVMQRVEREGQHIHDCFEILFILTGTCTVIINGQPQACQAEDILTVNTHVPHELRGVDCSVILVQFEQSLLERTLPEPKHPRFNCNSALQGNNTSFERLRTLIARLVKNNVEKQPGFELRNWSQIYELMDELYNNFRIDDDQKQEAKTHRYAARIAEITTIVNARYAENITLSELADSVFLSAPYLSKFFVQQLGMTFLNYLTKIRLNHAVEELLYTESTVEAISEHNGFPNSHAFVLAFRKEYGVLPSIYRRDFRKKEQTCPAVAVEQHDYLATLKKYLEQPTQESNTIQALLCTGECNAASPKQELRHTWKTFMTVGTAADLLYKDIQDEVRCFQRDIGFRFIVLGGILSDELRVCTRNMDGTLTFCFVYLDKVLDFILNVGLKPYLQLSFMPEALAKDPRKKQFNHLVSEPKNLDEWTLLVTATVRHLIFRYGKSEVRQWLFSVWKQPDTPRFIYAFSTNEAFYHFYQRTWMAVKDCDPSLVVGAPSSYYVVLEGHTNWYLSFIRWCRENDCVPDFLNFTYFDTVLAGTPKEGQGGKDAFGFVGSMTLNKASDGFGTFVNQLLAEVRDKLDWNASIYLTEWNSTPSQQDLLNDTCFKSCYIAKCILEQYDRLDSFAWWTLTDWMSEAPLPKELFFGGLGLTTVNGVPKAAYHVFRMLSKLGDTLLGQGPGWFVTAGRDGYQVMLYNYRHFSALYADGERFDMTFTDRYTPFEPEQAMDAQISLRDVENGEWLVRETILSRRHGSAFDIWCGMGALEPDTGREIDYLKSRAVPAQRKYLTIAENHTLQINAWLEMLEVRLLEIEKTVY